MEREEKRPWEGYGKRELVHRPGGGPGGGQGEGAGGRGVGR